MTAGIEISWIILTLWDHIVYGPQLKEMTMCVQPLCSLVPKLCNYFHFHFLNIYFGEMCGALHECVHVHTHQDIRCLSLLLSASVS